MDTIIGRFLLLIRVGLLQWPVTNVINLICRWLLISTPATMLDAKSVILAILALGKHFLTGKKLTKSGDSSLSILNGWSMI